MSDHNNRKISTTSPGFFQDIVLKAKLVLRLMGDHRVSPFLKILPIGALLYLVIPDLAIGPLDDAAVLYLGSYLFIELCPPNVVREHQAALYPEQSAPESPANEGIVIDAEYKDLDQKPEK